jgi:hypothetical protein
MPGSFPKNVQSRADRLDENSATRERIQKREVEVKQQMF